MENTCLILPYTFCSGVKLYSLVKICLGFGGLSCLHLECIRPQLPASGDKVVNIYLADKICIFVSLCGLTPSDKNEKLQ